MPTLTNGGLLLLAICLLFALIVLFFHLLAVMPPICHECGREIKPSIDEYHVVKNDGSTYTICCACYNYYLEGE